jgi:hypothetical protein
MFPISNGGEMVKLTDQRLEAVLELSAPYVSDLDAIRNWLMERLDMESSDIILDLERSLEEEENIARSTDYRILLNILKKF